MMMGMGMGMGMGVGSSLRMTVEVRARCPLCGADGTAGDHGGTEWDCDWQCPTKVLAELHKALDKRTTSKKVHCPKCSKGRCYTNADDFYECMECHTQYACSSFWGDETWEEVLMIDEQKDHIPEGVRKARVLPSKGTGNFPVENDLRRRIKNAQKAYNRLDRTLRSMRKWLGTDDIFFDGTEFYDLDGKSIDTLMQELLLKFDYTKTLY